MKEIKEQLSMQWGTELKPGEKVTIMVNLDYTDSSKEDLTVTKTIVLP